MVKPRTKIDLLSQKQRNIFLSYDMPELSTISLTVYDVKDQEVATLQNGVKPPGNYEVHWNGLDQSGNPVSTGVYFARLQAGDYSKTIKMVYLR